MGEIGRMAFFSLRARALRSYAMKLHISVPLLTEGAWSSSVWIYRIPVRVYFRRPYWYQCKIAFGHYV